MSMQFTNSIIRASAGSGKTYQLVRRYIRLLALGESPESIAAMTFTRKAAHEFFERILQKLAELSYDFRLNQGYVEEIRDQNHARELLRKVITSMDKMKLGTIDSFFASIVRCFPYELGLSGSADVMDEAKTKQARAEVMQHVLIMLSKQHKRQALLDLLEAWKNANFGQEENRPARNLSSWFESLHQLLLDAPEVEKWGGVTSIWKNRDALVYQKLGSLSDILQRLRDHANLELFDSVADRKWREFIEDLESYGPGDKLKDLVGVAYMFESRRIPAATWDEVARGTGEWSMSRKTLALGEAWGSALIDALKYLLQQELYLRSKRTEGRYKIIRQFDQIYDHLVRSAGRLAFSDLTWILSGKVANLSEQADWDALRLNWEYRLDTRFKHWMFDEFQDTSRQQWKIMQNLADEAARDPDGKRTFFAVGDLKQSLYLWRQAEPDLFLEIEDAYKDERMEASAPLTTSFRSSGVILEAVNRLFEEPSPFKRYYPDAYKWWRFDAHVVSETNRNKAGYVTFREIDAKGNKELADDALAEMIREVNPLSRGLSCAILVRTNSEAQRVAAALRLRLKVDVVCESEVEITKDNPATLLLLSLLQLSIHPKDSYALEHLRMSPLVDYLEKEYEEPWENKLGRTIRREIYRSGMLQTMTHWVARIQQILEERDAKSVEFTSFRLEQWLDLCAQFDADGSTSIQTFITTARDFLWRSSQNPQALQVMTIHKSKGLEFDMVVLPQLLGAALHSKNGAEDGFLVSRDKDGSINWLIDKPESLVMEYEPEFRKLIKEEKARAAYQGMCRIYVAMTRAKQALYMLKIKGGKKPDTNSEVAILESVFTDPMRLKLGAAEESNEFGFGAKILFDSGDPEWFTTYPILSVAPTQVKKLDDDRKALLHDRLRNRLNRPMERVTPSGEEVFPLKGSEVLSDYRGIKRQFGLLLHEVFSHFTYLSADSLNELEAKKDSLFPAVNQQVWEDTIQTIRNNLSDPSIAELFDPEQYQQVWTEKRFDLVVDRKWLTGIADRVVIRVNEQGEPVSARVVDFKTDSVPNEETQRRKVEGYRPQLEWYRKAVAKLTKLDESKIGLTLIFTQNAERVDLTS